MLKKDIVDFHLGKKPIVCGNSDSEYEVKIVNGYIKAYYFRMGVDGLKAGGEIFVDEDGSYPEFKIEQPNYNLCMQEK